MRMFILIAVAAIGLPTANWAWAGDCTTPACGKPACKKVCRVVCEMKKIEKTVWVVECEEFCVPNPSCGQKGCGCGRADGCKDGCGTSCPVPPRCGPVRCRKTLVKKTITCEVPVYKCVVVSCGCGQCGAEGTSEPVSAKDAQQAYLPAPLPRK